MPSIAPGNKLYFYQLFSRELGVGKQTSLARVEEVLAADGLAADDVGCADARALLEALPEFVKLTVFKKGVVFATVLANPEYDHALDRAAGEKDAGSAGSGKPWKRRRGVKTVKPIKPRHKERAAKAAPEPEPVALAEPEVVAPEAEPQPKQEINPEPAEPVAEPETVAPVEEPEAETLMSAPAATPEPGRAAGLLAASRAASEAQSAERRAGEEVRDAASPVSVETHEPPISFTITYVPEPEPTPEPKPAPALSPSPTPVQRDLPQDFHADVRCSNELLSLLYQLLPADTDPLAILEEDFRAARGGGTLDGTRSSVTFPLRYQQPSGEPVTATLRRSAKPVGGKRWALVEVEGATPEDAGFEGLAEAEGPLVRAERLLAQTVALGSWDAAVARLAQSLAPDAWGPDNCVLRGYLALTFARVQDEGLLATSEDGTRAAFDTGLLASEGKRLFAQLSAHAGDIPWQLDGFSEERGF